MSTTQEKRNSIIKDLKNLLIWISIALIIRWQVIEPRWIPSGSMLPTLQIQDKILVEKVTPKIKEDPERDLGCLEIPDSRTT